jgi:chloride intracellular channel protein 2
MATNGHPDVVEELIRRHPGHVIVRSSNGRVITTGGTVLVTNGGGGRVTPSRGDDASFTASRMASQTLDYERFNRRDDNAPPPSIELFVKAGKDGRRLGGCPTCQQVHLALAVKSSYFASGDRVGSSSTVQNGDDVGGSRCQDALSFVVTPVNMARPPSDFCRLQPSTRRLPVLVHRRVTKHLCDDVAYVDSDHHEANVADVEVLTDPDEILQYIDGLFPVPSMSYDTAGLAAVVCRDVFSRFSYFVKDVSGSSTPLVTELRRLDAYLSSSPFRYLNGDHRPDHLDCIVLPKLQHIRVTARAVKDFEIPAEFVGLWRYLATAYSDQVFRQTCPSDQEIVHHWQSKPECHRVPKSKQALYSPEGIPRYSMDVPSTVRLDRVVD